MISRNLVPGCLGRARAFNNLMAFRNHPGSGVLLGKSRQCVYVPPTRSACGQPSSAPGCGKRARKRPAAASASAAEHAPAVVHEGNAGEYSPAAPPRRVLRRPVAAVPVRYEVSSPGFQGSSLTTVTAEEPEWARLRYSSGEPVRLSWADDIVHTLVRNGHLPSSSQKKVHLKLWSDCSGINSEKFSWNELQDAMRRIIGADVSLGLYYTCDSDPKSIAFAKANHQPEHVGTDMSQELHERRVLVRVDW